MDWVHRGGPWTRSTGVVHGPGSVFCIRPVLQLIYIIQKESVLSKSMHNVETC